MADLHKLTVQEAMNASGSGGGWNVESAATHVGTAEANTVHVDVSTAGQIGIYSAGAIYFKFSTNAGVDVETDMITLYKWFVGEDNLIGQSPTPVQRKLLNAALGHIALENWKPYIDNMHEQVENFGRQMPEMKFFLEGSYLKFKTVKEIE